ncbi:MAG: glycerophosphodiester phosphodiesterase [Magnetococcales bacterium]|nr:glycerophosphodiester phosphodiesterase [Magnetococcales bacterium]
MNLIRIFSESKTARHFWVLDHPIAHRGLFDTDRGIPENSLAAFQRALAKGYAIELDVRLLADGGVAVFHDQDLERMTGEKGPVHRLETAQFRQLRLIHDHQPPPLLQDVFDLAGDRGKILVEIKDPTPLLAQAVVQVATTYRGRWAALSFHARSIGWFARNHPGITRGLNGGVFETDVPFLASLAIRTFAHAAWARPHFLGCRIDSLKDPLPRWFRRCGMPVVAWTARSEEDWKKAEQDADAVIFEEKNSFTIPSAVTEEARTATPQGWCAACDSGAE